MAELTSAINIVWLKRDFRLRDHTPLLHASQSGHPVLLVFLMEPGYERDPHYSDRHMAFIGESIACLNNQLASFNTAVLVMKANAEDAFSCLHSTLKINHIFSYQEIGLKWTFERDIAVKMWCQTNQVHWTEFPYGAVVRALPERKKWQQLWQKVNTSLTDDPPLSTINWLKTSLMTQVQTESFQFPKGQDTMQRGGEKRAWHAMKHFFAGRGLNYHRHISSPSLSRRSCSRLSPYLAWGNLSVRQIYRYIQSADALSDSTWKKPLSAFISRLTWHDHFIQKFESEHAMQHRAINRAYADFPYIDGPEAQRRFYLWTKGRTGVPLVDACMRALSSTGYINFRMRAMVTSFLCHHLNVHWAHAAEYLASVFLDFEPGIHYPQIQMQAGITGTNTIRLYNPVSQAEKLDPDGEFISRWIPELREMPAQYVAAPWKIPPLEMAMLEVNLPEHYERPIINIEEAYRDARDRLWSYRERHDVKAEAKRILSRHTLANSPSRRQAAGNR